MLLYSNRSLDLMIPAVNLQASSAYGDRFTGQENVQSALPTQLSGNPHMKGGKIWDFSHWIPTTFKLKRFQEIGPPYYNFNLLEEVVGKENYHHEIARFLKALYFWDKYVHTKKVSASQVWYDSWYWKEEAAAILSDTFAYSLRYTFGIEYTLPSDLDPRVKVFKLDSYDDIFPSRFALKWKEPDPKDFLYSLVPSPHPGNDILDSYGYFLDLILDKVPDNIPLIEDDEILCELGTTTSWVAELGLKGTMPHWETNLRSPRAKEFEKHRLQAIRCIVPVCPDGVRDTAIVDRPSNNSIRWIERQLTHILEYVPESAFTLYPSTLEARKEDVLKNNLKYSVLRDMKKCGLTHNTRHLFPIIREKLAAKFPYMPWERMDIFQNLSLMLEDGEVVYPQRGYFLGMANSLVTLSLIVIFRMACANSLSQIPTHENVEIRAIIGNDDSCVRTNSYFLAKEILVQEKFLSEALDNYFNLKKSFISEVALFYEEYSHKDFREKFSLVCNTLAVASLVGNARIAKMYVCSQTPRFRYPRCQRALEEVVASYPYEFYPSEAHYHYELGGWLDTRRKGLKTTLLDFERCLRNGVHIEDLDKAFSVSSYSSKPPEVSMKGTVGRLGGVMLTEISDDYTRSIAYDNETLYLRYRKLTVWQRNLTKRYKRIVWHAKAWKRTWHSKEDILRHVTAKDFYCIPDFAVLADEEWGYGVDKFWDSRPDKPTDNATLRQIKALDQTVVIHSKEPIELAWADFEINIPRLVSHGFGAVADLTGNLSFFGGLGVCASSEYGRRKGSVPFINPEVLPEFQPAGVPIRMITGRYFEDFDLPYGNSNPKKFIQTSKWRVTRQDLNEIRKEAVEDYQAAYSEDSSQEVDWGWDNPLDEDVDEDDQDFLVRIGLITPEEEEVTEPVEEDWRIQERERAQAALLADYRSGQLGDITREEDRMRDPVLLAAYASAPIESVDVFDDDDEGGIGFGMDDADY
ncbi:RNA-dependent RNA polymerase [Phytophthora cinnamomi ormycovirus 5-2]|uniref:RNA-dependent RNA polymerase n=1 Tax=Phytophthora cinnamomi ormycovirus 5-2 TaxID=3239324 RepID=A0AB39JDQ8_9VIRU